MNESKPPPLLTMALGVTQLLGAGAAALSAYPTRQSVNILSTAVVVLALGGIHTCRRRATATDSEGVQSSRRPGQRFQRRVRRTAYAALSHSNTRRTALPLATSEMAAWPAASVSLNLPLGLVRASPAAIARLGRMASARQAVGGWLNH